MRTPSEVGVSLRMRGNITDVRGGEYGGDHVLFIIDSVRNVEQCFHMADLQEGGHGKGRRVHCVTLNWWCTVTVAGWERCWKCENE